jgi:tetratricopeptide (TPR) repeat protein
VNASKRLEQLEKLLSAEPDDAFLNFGLAIELAKSGRHEESLARFDRALRADPNYVAAYYHKAKTMADAGDAEGARRVLEAGIAQAASCGEMHAKSEMEELLAGL